MENNLHLLRADLAFYKIRDFVKIFRIENLDLLYWTHFIQLGEGVGRREHHHHNIQEK